MKRKLKPVWKCNLPSMLQEMVENNPKMGIFKQPVNILGHILAEVATRASELNDDKLNSLMCRLSLYEIADQYSEDSDKKKVAEILAKVGEM